MEEREVGRRMPGAVPGGGPLEGETLSGLPIGLTMVSDLREERSAPGLVSPRVSLWSDVLLLLLGWLGLCRGILATL